MVTLDELLATMPGSDVLSDNIKQAALARSVIPDVNGVLPGKPGYVATYDAYFAAYSLIPLLSSQSEVTQAGSEGTSVTATPFDWGAFRTYCTQMSPIISRGNPLLRAVSIPGGPYLKPVDMQARDQHGDIDTDMG